MRKVVPWPGALSTIDTTAMILDDAVDRGQTHAGAFPLFFSGKERLIDTFHSLTVHADTVILDGKLDVRTGFDVAPFGRVLTIYLNVFQTDVKSAHLFPHGMGGVGAKIEQHLMNANGIPEDKAGVGIDIRLNDYGGRQSSPHHFKAVIKNGAEFDRV